MKDILFAWIVQEGILGNLEILVVKHVVLDNTEATRQKATMIQNYISAKTVKRDNTQIKQVFHSVSTARRVNMERNLVQKPVRRVFLGNFDPNNLEKSV